MRHVEDVKVRVNTRTRRQQLVGYHATSGKWLPLYVQTSLAYSWQHHGLDGKAFLYKTELLFRRDHTLCQRGPTDKIRRDAWHANARLVDTSEWQAARARLTSRLLDANDRSILQERMSALCSENVAGWFGDYGEMLSEHMQLELSQVDDFEHRSLSACKRRWHYDQFVS